MLESWAEGAYTGKIELELEWESLGTRMCTSLSFKFIQTGLTYDKMLTSRYDAPTLLEWEILFTEKQIIVPWHVALG